MIQSRPIEARSLLNKACLLALSVCASLEVNAQTRTPGPATYSRTAPVAGRPRAEAGSLRIDLLSADHAGVRLLLTSGVPRDSQIELAGAPYTAFELQNAGFLQEPGYPIVPRRRVLVEVPPGVDVQLLSTIGEDQYLPALAADPAPRLTTDAGRGALRAIPVPFSPTAWTLPEMPVRLAFVGKLRHRHVACLEFTPLRYDPATGGAHLARSLQVELKFSASRGQALRSSVTDGPWFESMYSKLLVNPGTYYTTVSPTGSTNLSVGPGSSSAAGQGAPASSTKVRWRLKLEVTERGLYALTPADLLAAGVDPTKVDPRRVGMSRLGNAIAIEVEGESDGSFDPLDRVLFYADPRSTKYTDTNAWWVFELLNGAGSGADSALRMQTIDAAPQPGDVPVTSFRETIRAETELKYWGTMPSDASHDHWYWTRTLAPATTSFTIVTPDPDPLGANLQVRAALHGYTDTVQNPDHHTQLLLNSTQIDDSTWDGMIPFLHDVPAAANLMLNGSNHLQLKQLLDLGAPVAGIYADWFEVDYDRQFIASADELLWSHASLQPESFAVAQFSSTSLHAFLVTDAANVQRFTGFQIASPGGGFELTLRNTLAGLQQYYLAADSVTRTPLSVTRDSNRIVPPVMGADLLIIAEAQFHAALLPLVQLREQSGMRVAIVEPENIYNAYGHGEFSPDAIQNFVRGALETWPGAAPSFLMMVGEANLDYRDHWQIGPWNSAPAFMFQNSIDFELPSDHHYVTVSGGDILPDLFVGRLPSSTPAELATVVAKIVNSETSPVPGAWQNEVVHIADAGLQFSNSLNLAASLVPGTHTVTNVFTDQLGSGTHNQIIAELGQGCVIASYFGHGAVYNWGNQLLDSGDVGGLGNGAKLPLVTALNCLSGFYSINLPPGAPPRCLAEELLLEPTGGSLASIAPSGLGVTWEHQRQLVHLYPRIFAGETIGEAHTGSTVTAYLVDSVNEHNLWSSVLFGDPSGHVLP